MRAVRVVVRGWVQGVGYRAYVVRIARELDLSGWVRNQSDGSVEAEAVGDDVALRRFAVALRSGPVPGRVLESTEQWIEAANAGDGFHVVR